METFYVTFCWRSPYRSKVWKINAPSYKVAWVMAHKAFEIRFHSILTEKDFKASRCKNFGVVGEIHYREDLYP